MTHIELEIEGVNGLKKTFLTKGAFKNTTGKTIKTFPFRTKGADKCNLDFRSFQGVVGECARMTLSEKFSKGFLSDKSSSFNYKLKTHVLQHALEKVESDEKGVFNDILVKLFFKDSHELIKFNNSVIKYMSTFSGHPALTEVAKMFNDIFINEEEFKKILNESFQEDNLFYQLIEESLPKLEKSSTENQHSTYYNSNPVITELFKKDLIFLASNHEAFLEHVEDLFKYYYFFYITQTAEQFDSLKTKRKINANYFTLEWESLSTSRVAYRAGWKTLRPKLEGVFAQAIGLELLNHISVNGEKIGDYKNIYVLAEQLASKDMLVLLEKVDEVINFYLDSNNKLLEGDNLLELNRRVELYTSNANSELDEKIKRLIKSIEFILEKSNREVAGGRYADWIILFARANFLKRRGRIGYTNNLTQETLLFLVKLSIGCEDRIRLNDLWRALEERGVLFDESTKTAAVKLFEKINLLEKKSDSGDAQYVKSFI